MFFFGFFFGSLGSLSRLLNFSVYCRELRQKVATLSRKDITNEAQSRRSNVYAVIQSYEKKNYYSKFV